MVQIVVPAETPLVTPPEPRLETATRQLAVGHDVVDSEAVTQSAIASGTPPPVEGVVPDVDSIDEAGTITPPPKPEPDVSDHQLSEEVIGYREELDVAWQSESTQRTKQFVLIGSLASFGLVAAAVVFNQVIRSWRAKDDVAIVREEPPLQSLGDINTRVAIPEPAAEVVPVVEPEVVTPEPVIDADTLPQRDPLEALATMSTQENLTGIVPPLVAAPFKMETAPEQSPVIAPGRDAVPTRDSGPPPLNRLPPELMKFAPLLSLETNGNQTAPELPAPPTIDSVRLEQAAKQIEAEATTITRKPIDIEKSLMQRFAIDNHGASLADLMMLLSQLTTVPIELELIAFDAAGIRVDAPIQSPSGWMTAKEWLDKLCSANGLVTHIVDGRVMISPGDEAIDKGIAAALSIEDFGDKNLVLFDLIAPLLVDDLDVEAPADDEANADAVNALLESVTQLSEDGRRTVPGKSLRSRMRAVLAIEAIRMMRSMPAKLDRSRTMRWMGPWPKGNFAESARAFGDWELVSRGISGPPLDSPRSTAGLIQKIASLNQANVSVGWFDATRQDFFPADLIMPYNADGTAGTILEEILGGQGLQARVCGPSLWYVGTEASYDRFEVFTWLPIPPGTSEAIRVRLANSLAVDDPASLPVVFENDRMLVRCPRYLARQLIRIIRP